MKLPAGVEIPALKLRQGTRHGRRRSRMPSMKEEVEPEAPRRPVPAADKKPARPRLRHRRRRPGQAGGEAAAAYRIGQAGARPMKFSERLAARPSQASRRCVLRFFSLE
jgi:hypothetical protein